MQKVLSEGVNIWQFFFFFILSWWGEGWSEYHYKRAINGLPGKRHLNGVLLASRWWLNIECWLGNFVIFQGIWTSIAKKPYIFVMFQGGLDPLFPPQDLCILIEKNINRQQEDVKLPIMKWASAWDFQQFGMCDQQSLRSACAYAQSDQRLC